MLFHRWPKKIFLLIFLFTMLFFGYSFLRSKLAILLIDQLSSVSKEVISWESMHLCPVCFGYGMCNEVLKGSILLHGELSTNSLWRKGVLQTRRVLISSPIAGEWSKLDEFICRNASQPIPCDLSSASWKISLVLENLLDWKTFRNLNALLDIPVNQFALPICSSEKLVVEMLKSFDENFDGQFSKEEKLLLLTSLIMQPGYVILMLQLKTHMTLPFPHLIGACGRSVILEGGVKSLKSYLYESFDTRAALAVQVLQLVEDFEEEDPQWYFLYLSFSLEGIVVTKEGEVVVLDLDNILVLDKATFPPEVSRDAIRNELCNEVCFQKTTLELFYSNISSSCSQVSEYSQLMYAIVCKQVLSNIEEHRVEGFFNFDGHRIHKKQEYLGLLHKMPYEIKDQIEDLLRECVQETKPNGRRLAVIELREILDNYLNMYKYSSHNSNKNPVPRSVKIQNKN